MTVVASNFERKANDLYETEAWATKALLRNMPFMQRWAVWEPSAGNHMIADVLRPVAGSVFTSDIKTYGREHDELFNFLAPTERSPAYPDAIITNPPYGKGNRDAVRYAELALTRCIGGWVALLLTAKFDFGKTRTHLFRDNRRFAMKIALIDRIQWFAGDTTGTEDHAWYVWAPTGNPQQAPRILYEGRER